MKAAGRFATLSCGRRAGQYRAPERWRRAGGFHECQPYLSSRPDRVGSRALKRASAEKPRQPRVGAKPVFRAARPESQFLDVPDMYQNSVTMSSVCTYLVIKGIWKLGERRLVYLESGQQGDEDRNKLSLDGRGDDSNLLTCIGIDFTGH
jgi:hypothetical protein